MTWNENKTKVVKDGKIKNIAIRHSEVKSTQSTLSNPIPAPRSKDIQDYLNNPTPYLTKFSQLYLLIKTQPKWQSRDDYIKLIIKQTADKSIKDRDIRNFLDYIKEAEEDSKTQKQLTDADLKEAKEMGYIAFFKEIYASAQDKLFLDKFMQNREVGDKDGMLLLKSWMDGNTKARLEEKSSDLTIVDEFKTKIQNATQINELNELNINIIDAVADGKFEKAKVIPVDINALHGLIDEKMVDLFKIKIGDIKDFEIKLNEAVSKTSSPNKLGYIGIMVSNEINRLNELSKKAQSSSLSQTKKDIVDILINSQKNHVRELKPKQEVKSLDDIGKTEKITASVDYLIKEINNFTTIEQLNKFDQKIREIMTAGGILSVQDPHIEKVIVALNTKRRTILGNDEALKGYFRPKPTKTVSEYEIKNLQYEAEHKPSKMLPPKEYDDVTKYTWGLTEAEAIKKYAEKEIKKNQSNIDFTNKQKTELEEMVKSKPHVLLTKAQIQKQYPTEAEQMLRDLWTYKTKKSDYEKNAESSKFWQSKVDKINSGEWQKINTNYLREAYQKEVKEAIKKGKPVPFDVIKQYPEFTKSQNSRERYDKGRHTSFANVSIAVDTKHQENHGIKMKLQDGTVMEDKYADEIIKTLSQYQSIVGDITPILRRENVTIAHTKYKHPFLSTAAGMYHPTDITVTMGRSGVGSHELTHFLDETAKRRHKDQPLYDYQLLAFAKANMNGGTYAIERAIALSKSKSPQELEDARELRFMLGTYWKRPEEIFARLMEQYTAYKNKGITDTIHLHYLYEKYIKTPAYWDDVTFVSMIPRISLELERKIRLAKE